MMVAARRVYQYLGKPGNTWSCVHAVRIILTGAGYYDLHGRELLPTAATLITKRERFGDRTREHAFIFWDWILGCTVVPSGFTSGYGGEGPRGLAHALLMLLAKDITVYEIEVDGGLFRRLNQNALTGKDIDCLRANPSMSFVDYNKYVFHVVSDEYQLKAATDKYAPFRAYAQIRIVWEWLDPEIADKCEKLAAVNMSSALAHAFIVLKSRLVGKFGLADTIDGEDLVNEIFGKDKLLALEASSEAERKNILAMRDLLAGLFKVFRNKYSHHDVEVPLYEADAVLSMVNFALKSIAKYKA